MTGRVYLTCDTNDSCAGQQPSHTCLRMGERSSSLPKDRTNVCSALPVPSGDTSDVSSGSPQAALVLIGANEEKN